MSDKEYFCNICYGSESVSESSHYSTSSESEDEYFSDYRKKRASKCSGSDAYSGTCSSDDGGKGDERRKPGSDQYPDEIREFINVKEGLDGPKISGKKDKSMSSDKLPKNIGKRAAEDSNKSALDDLLSDKKGDDDGLGDDNDDKKSDSEINDLTENVKTLKTDDETGQCAADDENLENRSDDETLLDDNDENTPSGGRSKRDVGGYSRYRDRKDRRDRHGDHDRRHRRRRYRRSKGWRMSKIICPTGKAFHITMPPKDKSGWRCGTKSKLILLKKDGKMGKREYTIVAKEMENTRATHTSGTYSGYEIIKIEKIVNPCLWKRYRYSRLRIISENQTANDHLMWHGSKHVAELVNTGFDERHANTRGMFGAGLYFAPNSSKSNQYIWSGSGGCAAHKDFNCFLCERQMLLCRVSLGKVMAYTTAQQHLAHPPVGYNSVEGQKGPSLQYNENIVYRGEQVYPEYLITYKIVP